VPAPDGPRRCAASRCHRTSRTGSRLCAGCRDRLAERLRELPARYGALAPSRPPGVPPSAHAAEARSAVRGVLAAWAHVVVGGRTVARPARSVAGLAGFLHRHVDWLGAHPAAGEIADELGDLAARLSRAGGARRAGELVA
jgi:hypothetical protein